MKIKILNLLLFTILLATVTSCRDDDSGFENIGGGNGNGVSFTLNIPGNRLPTTYSMDGDKENEVKEIDILVFKDENGTQKYVGHKQPSGDIINTSTGQVYQTKFLIVGLTPGSGYNLVIIANASAEVASILSGLTENDTKAVVLDKLEYTNTGKWKADGEGDNGVDYTTIPMACETGVITINDGLRINNLSLVRMLSRIDVRINAAVNSVLPDNFKLENIYLCNYNTKGYIAPKRDGSGNLMTTATGVNIPSDNQRPSEQTSLMYSASGLSAYEGEIYTFESEAAAETNQAPGATATCLVIEGEYQGVKSYYRVDFTTESTKEYMPLLRNFKYVVEVTEVSGKGYDRIEDALASFTVVSNMKVRTISYDEGMLTNVVFNGQYMLGVDKTEFHLACTDEFTANVGVNNLVVMTDNPSGWKIKILDDSGSPVDPENFWLKIDRYETTEANDKVNKDVTLLIPEINENTSSRIAYLDITAGRLNYRVKVKHEGAPNSYILYTGETLDIPVFKAYNIWKKELATTLSGSVKAYVLWQDVPNGGAVSSATLASGDQGISSIIRVIAGGQEGNAIVVVEVGDVIRWSWHIWVCAPNNDPAINGVHPSYDRFYTFMGRNLGAINNTKGDIGSHGFLYQWGRNNPFPGAAATVQVNNYDSKAIYSGTSSTILTEGSQTGGTGVQSHEVSVANNLSNAITNPLIFYFSNFANQYDWYSNVPGVHKDDLWLKPDGSKGLFDPCPDGWVVPPYDIPRYGTGISVYDRNWLDYPAVSWTIGEGADWSANDAGYFPATGGRHENGLFRLVGDATYLFCSDTNLGGQSNVAFIRKDGWYGFKYLNSNNYRSMGASIRCIKEIRE